jgi:hypothetical protein
MLDLDEVLEECVDSLHSFWLVAGQDGGGDVTVMEGLDEFDPDARVSVGVVVSSVL